MGNQIKKLGIYKHGKTIFDEGIVYVIPLYQRAYSWKEYEIMQLLHDIDDFDGKEYCIGTLIVDLNENEYEVIDGQQRLTTLFIMLHVLGLLTRYDALRFACRKKSNSTLENLKNALDVTDKDFEPGILNGIKVIEEYFSSKSDLHKNKDEFKRKLEKVFMYRIEVPENTDLNRYFEVMNTRGEQLEQHDVVKAKLMGCLKSKDDRDSFATIWDACSEMNRYIQMNFSKNKRYIVFNRDRWDEIEIVNDPFGRLRSELQKGGESSANAESLRDILLNKTDENKSTNKNEEINDGTDRFESIIDFQHFLLHVLKAVISIKQIKHRNSDEKIIDDSLDDKKLTSTFENVIRNGVINGEPIDKNDFSKTFINLLIKSRFLFDKFIIKREFSSREKEGKWSIKTLNVSAKENIYYSDTAFSKKYGKKYKEKQRHEKNIMIQSCLRVSYTSPKDMHWITDLLIELLNERDLFNLHEKAESIANDAVKKGFLNKCSQGQYNLGVRTPHIVFNYLDYLLWKKYKDNKSVKNDENGIKYEDFEFKFRNSVEHWYPQHPSSGTFEPWDDVDRFGNLCLVQIEANSKFSNLSPEAKKSTYDDLIKTGSLKLRIMSNKTSGSGNWKNNDCEAHENEMIKLLQDAVFPANINP